MGTAILTFTALTVAASLNVEPTGRRPFGSFLALQLVEARFAYETGGPEALQRILRRFHAVTGAEAALTDARGVDLLTGEDRSELVRQARREPRLPFFNRSRSVAARRSDDGRYMYFLMLRRGNWLTWFFQPEIQLPVLGVLLVLCYGFARHLTSPVRELQRAVDCFGRGDMVTRVNSTRKDELGQLARTFDTMAERIQSLLAAQRQLLLDISHELRSPLARLSVAVELARSDSGDQTVHLDRIEKEATRLNTLVGELLQVTRAEGDVSQLHLQPVNLSELVSEIIADCRIEAHARGCTIAETIRPDVVLQGDAEILRRAMENVIRNAIRYTPAGSEVVVIVEGGSDEALVTVRDHGSGVPEDSLGKIFDPFYRVESDRNRSTGGVGLGLAIVRRSVNLHEGRVWAENASPGLLVSIALPLRGRDGRYRAANVA